ncbi:MAG: hypothetical protein D6813_13100 [Calditrichaeota bacterium]|nr:MAG: hypothetical protein D6813_13100 [Calditrichota bacterium]
MAEDLIEIKKLRLAESVGEFIKYWGFKEIHGRIWLFIYLSKSPITAKELTAKLGVTKGLVSIALSELLAYGVIEKVNLGNPRSPGYQSSTNLVDVISNILRKRELKMTTNILNNIQSLAEEMKDEDPVVRQKLKKLQDITQFAVDSLTKLLDNKPIMTNRWKQLLKIMP